jgi:diadenosine tetraphosphate (Ap4A) HIT family hydrolase
MNHIPPEDGGHLIVFSNRHIHSRIEATKYEILEMWDLSIIAGKLLNKMLNIDWYNFQENGNWNMILPTGNHFHLHIYGRSRQSNNQIFGEPLHLPKNSSISLESNKYSKNQILKLKHYAKIIDV